MYYFDFNNLEGGFLFLICFLMDLNGDVIIALRINFIVSRLIFDLIIF